MQSKYTPARLRSLINCYPGSMCCIEGGEDQWNSISLWCKLCIVPGWYAHLDLKIIMYTAGARSAWITAIPTGIPCITMLRCVLGGLCNPYRIVCSKSEHSLMIGNLCYKRCDFDIIKGVRSRQANHVVVFDFVSRNCCGTLERSLYKVILQRPE